MADEEVDRDYRSDGRQGHGHGADASKEEHCFVGAEADPSRDLAQYGEPDVEAHEARGHERSINGCRRKAMPQGRGNHGKTDRRALSLGGIRQPFVVR